MKDMADIANRKRMFIINELIMPDFFSLEDDSVVLHEFEESGKSELVLKLKSEHSLCIKNIDKKHTELHFFDKSSKKSMYKRVDHIIFENIADNDWIVHLIEMKSSVGAAKWYDIKGKFRASYLFSKGLAAMLEMDIKDYYFYTSYEKADLNLPETMPMARRVPVGMAPVRPQEEWDGNKFFLNLGERIFFRHIPVQMTKTSDMVLTGEIAV